MALCEGGGWLGQQGVLVLVLGWGGEDLPRVRLQQLGMGRGVGLGVSQGNWWSLWRVLLLLLFGAAP